MTSGRLVNNITTPENRDDYPMDICEAYLYFTLELLQIISREFRKVEGVLLSIRTLNLYTGGSLAN